MAVIRAQNIYKVFGRKPEAAVRRLQQGTARDELRDEGLTAAVIDASFEAQEGETFVVMGLSGSGKSTLIRMLNGILPATSGSVFVDDEDVTRLGPKDLRTLRSRKMSMVFQHFALFPHRTVLDNAAYGLEVRGAGKQEQHDRAAEALATVGLEGWGTSYPGQLSGGMKQRVGLARALATNTEVMLMDEAFSALDPLIRREMQDQLIELQHRLRKTIVFITHDLNEAMKLGDHIAVMRDGRVVQIGTAEQILNEPANDYVASFIEDVDRSRVLTAGSVMTEPLAVAREHDSVEDARRTMRDNHVSGLFVVGAAGRLIGGVTADELSGVSGAGNHTVGEYASPNIVVAEQTTVCAELLASAATTDLPLAVVDGDHRLVGVASRATLLAAVGGAGDKPAPDEDASTDGRGVSTSGSGGPVDLDKPAGLQSRDDGTPVAGHGQEV